MAKPVTTSTASGYTLTKAIPIPAEGSRSGKSKYPWTDMQVSDSFFVPEAKAASFYPQCSDKSKKFAPKKFISKSWTEAGVEGVRVWRTL